MQEHQIKVPVQFNTREALLRGLARQGSTTLSLSDADVAALLPVTRQKLAALLTDDGEFIKPLRLVDATVQELVGVLAAVEAPMGTSQTSIAAGQVSQEAGAAWLCNVLTNRNDGHDGAEAEEVFDILRDMVPTPELLEAFEAKDRIASGVVQQVSYRDLLGEMDRDLLGEMDEGDIIQWVKHSYPDQVMDAIGKSGVLQWLTDNYRTSELLDDLRQEAILKWVEVNCDTGEVLEVLDRDGTREWIIDTTENIEDIEYLISKLTEKLAEKKAEQAQEAASVPAEAVTASQIAPA